MLGYWGWFWRRFIHGWFVCLCRRGDSSSSRMGCRYVLNDTVLKQDEGFARELFPVVVFNGVMQDGGGLSGG